MSIQYKIVRLSADNYYLFRDMVNWRVTGERRSASGTAIEEDFEFLQHSNFWTFAAQVEGGFVGWITAVLIPKPDRRRGLLYVDELWLAPEYRGARIADALMQEVFSIARDKKLWKVRLYVGADNPTGRSFYKRMGFTEASTAMFCQRDVPR